MNTQGPWSCAQRLAAAAVRAMQATALHARAVHARAELLRHMRGTAAKPGPDKAGIDESTVAQEWMQAWGMADWPEVAGEMRGFVAAFCAYAAGPSDAADAAVPKFLPELSTAAKLSAIQQRRNLHRNGRTVRV